MHSEPELPPLPDDDADGQREWRALRGNVRHQTVGMIGEIFALLRILLQDAIILVVGFAIEFAFEHWLHSEQPFFRFAVTVSSAVFLLLYLIMVTVHVIHYVKEQFGATAASLLNQYVPWGLAAAGIIAAAVAFNGRGTQAEDAPPATHGSMRLAITLPPGQHLAELDQPAIAISPDGMNLVYVASQSRAREQAVVGVSRGAQDQGKDQNQPPLAGARGSDTGTQMLYLRPLDSEESRPITGTEGAVAPFFSPDGEWIGFFADGKLKKISINGGAAVVLAIAPNPGGASWSNQRTILLQGTTASGLQQIGTEGGAVQSATRVGIGGIFHRWPEPLPDGLGILFTVSQAAASWSNAQVLLQPPAGGELRILAQGTQPRYVASSATSGHLLYSQGGSLLAAPYDLHRQRMTGSPATVLQGLMSSVGYGSAQYSISSTGTLVYLEGTVSGAFSQMVWVSRSGSEEILPAPARAYAFPRLSPDARRVAMGISDQDVHIGVYDLSRNTLTRLTLEGNANNVPAWTADGKRISFYSNRADTTKPANLYLQAADGSRAAERLNTSDFLQSPGSFSADGKLLAFMESAPETSRDIWVMNLSDSEGVVRGRKGKAFLNTRAEEGGPRFSPDVRWLAYSSDESGRREIYVQPYPGPGGKWLISTEGGQEPVWNPNGNELFYRSGTKMMAVDVDTKSGFAAGNPHVLFDGPYLRTNGSFPWYDVSPDGQRFLMLKPADSPAGAPTQINVVLNFFEELKQKVPVKQ